MGLGEIYSNPRKCVVGFVVVDKSLPCYGLDCLSCIRNMNTWHLHKLRKLRIVHYICVKLITAEILSLSLKISCSNYRIHINDLKNTSSKTSAWNKRSFPKNKPLSRIALDAITMQRDYLVCSEFFTAFV